MPGPDDSDGSDRLTTGSTTAQGVSLEGWVGPSPAQGALEVAGERPMDEGGAASGNFASAMTIQASLSAFSSPFIPPDVLAAYEQARPGMGDTLIKWTERQQTHRMRLEWVTQVLPLVGSVTVALSGLAASAFVAASGREWAASIIAIAAIGGPVAAQILAARFGAMPQKRFPPIPRPNTAPPRKRGKSPEPEDED